MGRDADVDRALDAMTAGELRSLVKEALARLDGGPSPEILIEVRQFVEDALRAGEADAEEAC